MRGAVYRLMAAGIDGFRVRPPAGWQPLCAAARWHDALACTKSFGHLPIWMHFSSAAYPPTCHYQHPHRRGQARHHVPVTGWHTATPPRPPRTHTTAQVDKVVPSKPANTSQAVAVEGERDRYFYADL